MSNNLSATYYQIRQRKTTKSVSWKVSKSLWRRPRKKGAKMVANGLKTWKTKVSGV